MPPLLRRILVARPCASCQRLKKVVQQQQTVIDRQKWELGGVLLAGLAGYTLVIALTWPESR